MLAEMDEPVETGPVPAFPSRRGHLDTLPALALRPLIAEYTATFGSTWAQVTRRKHRDDFARLTDWLEAHGLPVTTASLDFMTLVDYVTDLRARPKVAGVWRGASDALGRSLASGPIQTLSANSVNAYVRPLRSLAIWLVRAIVSILVTTAARNSSVRLLRIGDVDFERAVILFRRAKGGKTLELALQPGTASYASDLPRSCTGRLPAVPHGRR